MPAGPLAFAAVLEASEQSYDLKTDPRIFPSVREIYNLTGTGSAGFVWDIIQDLSLTVDYYKIRLYDEVTVQAGTTILQDEYGCVTGNYPSIVNGGGPFPYAAGSAYCLNIASLLSRDPANDDRLTEIRSGPINIAYRAVKGIDASLKYRWETGFGTFNANLAWSHVLGQESQAREGVQVISYRDLNSNSDFRSRVRATVNWTKDEWDATVFMNRQGSFPLWNLSNYGFSGTPVVPATNPVTFNDDAYLTNRTQPYITYNMSVGYRFNEKFSMRLSINNVFDNTGGFDPTFNSYPYTWQSYDLIGRTFGLQANYAF